MEEVGTTHLGEDCSNLILGEGNREVRDNDFVIFLFFALGVIHPNSFVHPQASIFLSHRLLCMLFVLEDNETI